MMMPQLVLGEFDICVSPSSVILAIIVWLLFRWDRSEKQEQHNEHTLESDRTNDNVEVSEPDEGATPTANSSWEDRSARYCFYWPSEPKELTYPNPQICPFKERWEWANLETELAWGALSEGSYWRNVAYMVASDAQKRGLSGICLWTHARSQLAKLLEGDAGYLEDQTINCHEIAEQLLREVVV